MTIEGPTDPTKVGVVVTWSADVPSTAGAVRDGDGRVRVYEQDGHLVGWARLADIEWTDMLPPRPAGISRQLAEWVETVDAWLAAPAGERNMAAGNELFAKGRRLINTFDGDPAHLTAFYAAYRRLLIDGYGLTAAFVDEQLAGLVPS